MSPHALVQEYLNLTEHLFAVVTNGRGAMAAFGEQRGDRVVVDAFEVRLPAPLVASGESGPIQSLLDSTAEVIDRKGPTSLRTAFEGASLTM